MKLVRFGQPGREKPGIVDSAGRIRDLSGVVSDIAGEALSPASLAKISAVKPDSLPLADAGTRIGPCVGSVRHFIAIGLNYADHAAETGAAIPKEPIIFSKAPTCICGPNDDTMIPVDSAKLDYEAELGIVIGSRARNLSKDKAMEAVAGYFLSNDVSERSFQLDRSGGQWDKGKGCETFGPIGPWLVTKDEIPDPGNLDIWLTVNGETRQKGSTKTMIFNVEHIVWYCSQFFIMEPGDIIVTGTPPGVALGMKPPKFLKAGDVVKLGIAGLGEQQQTIVPFRP